MKGRRIRGVVVALGTLLGSLAPMTTAVAVGSVGPGTIAVSPQFAAPSSKGNTLVFTYRASAVGLKRGEVTIVVPGGWTKPQPFSPATC